MEHPHPERSERLHWRDLPKLHSISEEEGFTFAVIVKEFHSALEELTTAYLAGVLSTARTQHEAESSAFEMHARGGAHAPGTPRRATSAAAVDRRFVPLSAKACQRIDDSTRIEVASPALERVGRVCMNKLRHDLSARQISVAAFERAEARRRDALQRHHEQIHQRAEQFAFRNHTRANDQRLRRLQVEEDPTELFEREAAHRAGVDRAEIAALKEHARRDTQRVLSESGRRSLDALRGQFAVRQRAIEASVRAAVVESDVHAQQVQHDMQDRRYRVVSAWQRVHSVQASRWKAAEARRTAAVTAERAHLGRRNQEVGQVVVARWRDPLQDLAASSVHAEGPVSPIGTDRYAHLCFNQEAFSSLTGDVGLIRNVSPRARQALARAQGAQRATTPPVARRHAL